MDSEGTRALGALAAPWSPWSAIRSPLVRNVLGFCVFELAFLGAYHFGMQFSEAVSAPFWIPDSVLLCALLCTRARWWWLLFAGTLPIRLFIYASPEIPTWFLVTCVINDCAKAAGGAWILRRFVADPIRLNSLRDLGVYWLFLVVLIPVLSAFGGAATRSALGYAYWPSFEQWLLGDALASLILTPILFYWVLRPPNPATFRLARVIEAGALTIGLMVTMAIAFDADSQQRNFAETRFYAPVPFMVWAAIRFRMLGATAAAAMLTIFALDAAMKGAGSFDGLSPEETASRLQHFLMLRVAPLYLVGVLIEQRLHVSHSLRESEQRFRKMADDSPMMIWTAGADGGNEFVNKQWLDFTGLTLEEFRGDGWKRIVHPDDVTRSMSNYLDNVQARRPYEDETRLRRHDGEYRWVLARGQPRYGDHGEFLGYVGSAMDVTDRRQQEAALRRSEARYRDVVESQASFVCRFLADTSLTFVNTTYCRFLGRTRLDLLGANFLDLFSTAARPAVSDAVSRALASSGQAAWECEVVQADGTRGWQSWVCHVIEAPEEPREIQAIGYDITDRKRGEESARQLAHAARFAVVGELTAMVAHEVNQPLTAILSNAEAAEIMLRAEEPPLDELRHILADIRQDDLRADAAIRSIRSMVHRREFQPRPTDLAQTIEHVFQLTGGDALHRRVTMRREIATDLPLIVGDRSHLEQLLVILIVNAMDAMKGTPEGSREVVVAAQPAEQGMVEVAVRDRGHGISPQNMPQLFDSLFTTKAEGMGLGLPIARSIVNAHGGRIWPDNAPGGGAVFRFTLRVAAAPA